MKREIQNWIKNWIGDLSKIDKRIGVALCPFASKAWDQGAVNVIHTDDLWESVHKEVKSFGKHKVVLCMQNDMSQDYEDLELECAALNRWFSFNNMDIWLLSSYKDYAIVFIQRLSELDSASAALEKLGYYEGYEKADYDRLVMQRRNLHKKSLQQSPVI